MSKSRKILIIAIIVIVFALLAVVFMLFNRFDSYDEDSVIPMENAQRTQYHDLNGKLLSYNLDGAILMDYSGNLIWTIGYEMQDPRIDKKNTCALLYDKQGTTMKIVSDQGEDSTIRTTLPITAASVSDKRNVAVVMQEEDTAYIKVYDVDGSTMATGELNLTDSGYPLSVALSSDGQMMAISTLHLLEGKVKSEILFFNFSKAGNAYDNNKVGAFSYSDMVIPQVSYVENDKLLAIGDSEIIVFGNQTEPKPENELFFTNEIKSVFFNNNYVGTITSEVNEEEELVNLLTVYGMNGHEKVSKTIEHPYNYCEVLRGNEILLSDGHNIAIYTLLGVKKFEYQFAEEVQRIIPAPGSRNYYMFHGGQMSKIYLR